MWRVRVQRTFSAAHRIQGSAGRCEEFHGHNYRVEVELSAPALSGPGMVADFVEVGAVLESILPDHKMLNEVYDFNPTAENLARRFHDEMSKRFRVSRVTVWETDRTCAEYSAD